jgi:predicted nucleic acid-binding protein
LQPNPSLTLTSLRKSHTQEGLVQAKWTNQILDETFESIVKHHPSLDPGKLARTRELMSGAIRDCLVTGYEALVDVVTLPDPDDRHVLAAAIKSRAQVIVTSNIKDLPESALEQWNVEAKTSDEFMLDQFYLSGPVVWRCPVRCGQLEEPARNCE